MLTELFPRSHERYSALPLLGSVADGFAGWLLQRGYLRSSIRQQLRSLVRIDRFLQQRGHRQLSHCSREDLQACSPAHSQQDRQLAGTVHSLERYLDEQGLLPAPAPSPSSKTGTQLDAYRIFLEDLRGLADSTVIHHLGTVEQFLEHLKYEENPSRLAELTASNLEAFVKCCGVRLSRASLQHTVAHLRGFLRFLEMKGEVPAGLDTQIDTPRIYRLEQLPRALPWETVTALLQSIDRSTALGLRDYTMFSLISTYGLRACEIVGLRLDDIDWRAERIQVASRKTGSQLLLPLMDVAGEVLCDYLCRARPDLPYRELFLRGRAPVGVLKPTAVTEAFQAWSRRSGLDIPYQGPHCLRHAYAVHLLKSGVSLKTIGDLLGHRSAESTCVYLRLAVEDLRDVALPLPTDRAECCTQEVIL